MKTPSVLTAALLLALAMPALAAEQEVLTTWNKAAVANWPHKLPQFTLSQPARLTYIDTYHWNGGQGSPWGNIRVVDQAGNVYGPWQVELKSGMGNAQNVHWVARPNVTLPAATYTVQDSDWTTWSANAGSGWVGFTTVRVAEDEPAPPAGFAPGRPGTGYLGCYKDQDRRDLSGHHFDTGNMTSALCIAECAKRGYAYAATQYASHCFCDNRYGRYGTAQNCDMNCRGNAAEMCGGAWANSVYGTAATPAATGSDVSGRWRTSEGEMTLNQNGRDISGRYTSDNGEIVGTLDDNVLDGYWIEDNASVRCATARNGRHYWGRIRYRFDGGRFTGQWSYCDNPVGQGNWTGERIGASTR